MKKVSFVTILFLSLLTAASGQSETRLFDSGWRFHRGGAQGAERPSFDDSKWRNLDLPHDWSIEDLTGTKSPFSPDAINQVSGGFTSGGTGWYRKTFDVPAEAKGKNFVIVFDGVYMNSEVWVNGNKAGSHPYGYTSFWFDITKNIKYGGQNTIAVKVKNEGENSRWYSGSGIYRHVWLKVLEPVHFAQWGISVTTPEVSQSEALVNISAETVQAGTFAGQAELVIKMTDAAGVEMAGKSLPVGKTENSLSDVEMKVARPVLWSPDNPYLYTLVCELRSGGKTLDRVVTRFGIRTISLSVGEGFLINGKQMKLRGGCLHHDNGPLGAKAYDRAEERRVQLLKDAGFNALRCAHNPPSPAFLDACDRLGMLVIDEAFDMWQYPKNPHDYSLFFTSWWLNDVASMIERDRNHPSVIMWSIGNEIQGMDNPEVVNTARELADFARKKDPARKVIAAVNNLNPAKDPFFAALDIAGYNYGSGGDHMKENIFVADNRRKPDRIMIQTESYPLEAFRSWMDVVDNTFLLGDFVWTAFDYIGEASIGWRGYWQEQGFYPWNLAFCGDIDICGWKRPQSYYRDALWKKDQLSVFVTPPVPSFPLNDARMSWSKWHWHDAVADWNWDGSENTPLKVTVYSSCEEVELFVNGKSLGRKKTGRSTEFMTAWDVPYSAGELKAVGYSGRKRVAESVLRTAGESVSLKVIADRANIVSNGQDLCYVTVELTDKDGVRNPKAENLIKFDVSGPGTIIAVGNANPVSLESYLAPERKAWQGRALVIIKSGNTPGEIKLTVSSEGLAPEMVIISSGK